MSSFVISKREYIKAAGLLYGIEEKSQYPHKYFLDNVRKNFCHVYELNVASVNEQYGDDGACDSCEYDEVFKRYCYVGRCINDATLKELLPCLLMFFRSSLYQIENEEYAKEVGAFFFECFTKLNRSELNSVEGWWGQIDL